MKVIFTLMFLSFFASFNLYAGENYSPVNGETVSTAKNCHHGETGHQCECHKDGADCSKETCKCGKGGGNSCKDCPECSKGKCDCSDDSEEAQVSSNESD